MLNHPAGHWGSAGIYTPESQNQGTTNHRITKSRNQKMLWEGRALDPILFHSLPRAGTLSTLPGCSKGTVQREEVLGS